MVCIENEPFSIKNGAVRNGKEQRTEEEGKGLLAPPPLPPPGKGRNPSAIKKEPSAVCIKKHPAHKRKETPA